MNFSLDAQIEEVEREIGLRVGVYPRMVASGKMRESVAKMHMDRMGAVLDTLRWLRDHKVEVLAKALRDAGKPAA